MRPLVRHLAFALACLITAPALAEEPGLDPVLAERWAIMEGEKEGDLYQPRGEVPGFHDGFMEVTATPTVASEALNAARKYALDRNSSAFMVWHAGALQMAVYAKNTGPATLHNSRSMHKMLGGLVIGAAIQQGHIAGLDAPVAAYIRPWAGTDKEAMTIRHVLHNASGMPGYAPWEGPEDVMTRRYIGTDWDSVLLNEVALATEPGSTYAYGDPNADVMPHIIEGATGQPYVTFLSEAILKPIGAAGGNIWLPRPGEGTPHGGCCLFLPAETWLRIGILLANEGIAPDGTRVLPEGWIEDMLTRSEVHPDQGLMVWLSPQPARDRRSFLTPEPVGTLGTAWQSEPFRVDDVLIFDGNERRMMMISPSRDLVFVRHGSFIPQEMGEWDDAFIMNTLLDGLEINSQ